MKNLLHKFEAFLKHIDSYRDRFLFLFIKPYWPRKITPNHVTWLRIGIALIIFVLVFFFNIENKVLIISLFCFGAFTDLIDGPIARGLDKVTEFGAMLDPIADKILIIPIAIYSLFLNAKWLLLALILSEFINGLAMVFYKSKAIYTESNIFAKTKMVLQSLVFIVILVVWPNAPAELFFDILWISIIFSILSVFARLLELKNKGHAIKNL